jgi:hypothetical protein
VDQRRPIQSRNMPAKEELKGMVRGELAGWEGNIEILIYLENVEGGGGGMIGREGEGENNENCE